MYDIDFYYTYLEWVNGGYLVLYSIPTSRVQSSGALIGIDLKPMSANLLSAAMKLIWNLSMVSESVTGIVHLCKRLVALLVRLFLM